MRITRIKVEKLFGNPTYNYDIGLKIDQDSAKRSSITILHGRNGSGKTVIFKMIAGLFGVGNYNPFIFWKYPFRLFEVAFDDGSRVSVTREYNSENPLESYPTIKYIKGPGRPKQYDVGKNIKSDLLRRLPLSVRRDVSDGDLVHILSSLGDDNYETVSSRPLYDGSYYLDPDRFDEPPWLGDLRSTLDVHFVSTNRLLIRKRVSGDRPSVFRSKGREITSAAAIEENSLDLKRRISKKIFTANRIENDLNRIFPSNVVSSVLQKKDTWSYRIVADELEKLKRERERLVDVGILDPGDEINVEEYNDDTLGRVLKQYIEDSRKKFNVYDGLANKIDLFKVILQDMLNDKHLIISKEKGYLLKPDPGSDRCIPAKELSSGEQHLIVLVYNLLFRDTEKNDELILIDEPEISLHIAWQRRFVSSLEKISELSDFDVIIATHSPAIVRGRWDLEVSLHGDVGE